MDSKPSMTDVYETVKADLDAAQARMNALLEARAREIYPGYDRYPFDDSWGGDSVMTKTECHKTAQATFERRQTAEEFLAHQEANKRILRTALMPVRLINDLQVETLWSKRRAEEIVEGALAEYLKTVVTAPPTVVVSASQHKSYGLTEATDNQLRILAHKFQAMKSSFIIAALEEYFSNNPVSRWYSKK